MSLDQYKETGFITTYLPIAGWKAIHYWWNPDMGGFWEPWSTGDFAYDTEAEAIEDAKLWAECDDIPYLPREEAV